MQWDKTVDVLVVGSGNGGLTAAVCCYEFGVKNVLVVEKGAKFGGTSSYSGGGIWIPCNHYAKAAGAQDSLEEAREYLRQTIPDVVDPALVETYITTAPEMLKFLHDRTQVRYETLEHYPDYFTDLAGSKPGHRSLEPEPVMIDKLGAEADNLMLGHPMMTIGGKITISQVEARLLAGQLPGWGKVLAKLLWQYVTDFPWRFKSSFHRRLACGSAGVARLRLSMMDRNLPLWLNSPLVELIKEGDRVVGAVVEHAGKRMNIKAERGVVLAAGGFEKNQAMREKYLPKPTDAEWSAGVFSNEGDAITAGQKVGGALKLMDSAWWVTTFCVPGEPIPYLAIMDKSFPGSCTVNQKGKRISNESQNYMSYMKEAFAKHTPENPSSPAFMIFDANFRRKYFVGPLLNAKFRPDFMLPKRYYDEGFMAKADTIPELAKKMNIDVDGLVETVEKMNQYAKTGKDPELHRGDALYDRYYGDPSVKPNPCLGPIAQPPFYAVRMDLGDFGTNGGLVTDIDSRVQNENGEAIPGLYAIGNSAAGILITYPGPGSTLGPAMTFAYRAARNIAGLS